MSDERPVRRALLLSDLHLGWVVCHELHRTLLDRLPEAVDDAELIVLNGDIVDACRGVVRTGERELIDRLAALVRQWRGEGRRVVYLEGNHDPARPEDAPLPEIFPEAWRYDFLGATGERVRVLHGHRFTDAPARLSAYEARGRPLLGIENRLHAKYAASRALYRAGAGWLVGTIGYLETALWLRRFSGRVASLLAECDVLVHGHFHFGPGRWRIGGKPVWKSGPWASAGHFGSVDRMLRYDDGRFERLRLTSRGFVPIADGS
jgi:UDP-2,3-diacylglucosamine pyrophosphatase LpxH